jgi:hypothetical protein
MTQSYAGSIREGPIFGVIRLVSPQWSFYGNECGVYQAWPIGHPHQCCTTPTNMPHIHQLNEEKDQNMSEIQSKLIWYNKILIQKCIWLYLGQFLTVFDDPGIKFTALYVGTWYKIRSHDKTGLLRFYDNFQK